MVILTLIVYIGLVYKFLVRRMSKAKKEESRAAKEKKDKDGKKSRVWLKAMTAWLKSK